MPNFLFGLIEESLINSSRWQRKRAGLLQSLYIREAVAELLRKREKSKKGGQ